MIAIESLDRHRHFIPQLAREFAREWPDWARTISSADLEALFLGGTREALPIVLVAFDAGDLLGTIALRPWLYAGTNRIEALLRRRGWEVYRRLAHGGQPMAWFRKPLQAAGELTR